MCIYDYILIHCNNPNKDRNTINTLYGTQHHSVTSVETFYFTDQGVDLIKRI